VAEQTFNRTKLELKWLKNSISIQTQTTFNRTKLELKSAGVMIVVIIYGLLIAPNWNWNSTNTGLHLRRLHPFNRTKLELKWNVLYLDTDRRYLLIAPNWNWNLLGSPPITIKSVLLIAPNWNWNILSQGEFAFTTDSFNRTKLELKSDIPADTTSGASFF